MSNTIDNEFITRGEFQNVIGMILATLEKIDSSISCMQADVKTVHNEIDQLKDKLAPLSTDYEEKKDEKHDNKLAMISFLSSVGSTILSAVVIIMLGLK